MIILSMILLPVSVIALVYNTYRLAQVRTASRFLKEISRELDALMEHVHDDKLDAIDVLNMITRLVNKL